MLPAEPPSVHSRTPSGAERWALSAIVLLAAGLRAVVALMSEVVSPDGSSMIRHAVAFAAGNWQSTLDHSQHPLTTIVLSIPIWFGAAPLPSALVTMAILGALVVLPVWVLARDVGGPAVGLIAALFAALGGVWLEHSAVVLTEPLYTLCLATCASAGWRAIAGGRPGAHLLFGVSGALAYLTRPEGLILPAVTTVFLLAQLAADAPGRRRRLVSCLLGGIVAALLMAPYVGYLSRDRGLTLTLKKSSRPDSAPTPAEQRAIDRLLRQQEASPPTQEAANLGDQRHPLDILQETIVSGYSPPLAVLAFLLAVGGARMLWRRTRPTGGWLVHVYLAAALAAYLAVFTWHLTTHGYLAARQVSTTAVFVLPWAAVSVATAGRLVGRGNRRRELFVILVLVCVTGAFQLYKGMRRHGADKRQLVTAAEVLSRREHGGEPGDIPADAALVMGTLPRVAFYAGLRFAAPPDREPWYLEDEWNAILGESIFELVHPRYLVIERRSAGGFRAVLEDPRLREVGRIPAGDATADVWIYEVAPK